MYCKKCGAAIAGNTEFCPICNHWIAADDVEETDRSGKEQERKPFVFVPMKRKKVHKGSSVAKAVLSISILCFICGAFLWLGTGGDKESVLSFIDKGNTTEDFFAEIENAIDIAILKTARERDAELLRRIRILM